MATVVVSAQANGLKRVIRRQGKEQAPAATTKSAGAKRRCPAECRQLYRRHGESGATGTVAASAAVDPDLRHQTLAVRPETACGFGGARQVRQQLPWRSVARRPDSAVGREPKVSSVGVLLKPLRVKKRHHSRKRKRKQTDSSEQTGNVKMQAGENMFSCRRKEAMINRRHTRRGVRNGAYFPS